jgi:hypothetical protein
MFATVPVSTTCCRAYYRVLRAHRGVVRHRRIHTRGIDDAHEQPRHATITPHPLGNLQGDAIAAPEGEEPMPAAAVASVPHTLASWWRMPGAVGTLIEGTLFS